MKSKIIITLTAILLIATACLKEPVTRLGFDASFNKNSEGITIMHVSKNASAIILKGNVLVNIGEVTIELTDPTGETIYVGKVVAPENLEVNQSYTALPGNWKLKYRSNEGEGSLKLHLQIID
jgi:hypothetical protein